jgi:hypothetical protein
VFPELRVWESVARRHRIPSTGHLISDENPQALKYRHRWLSRELAAWRDCLGKARRFIAVHSSGDVEITAALRLAAEKWGRSITITGSREFKERSLAITVELGIEVRNRELAEKQRQLRQEREGRLRRPAPRSAGRGRDHE